MPSGKLIMTQHRGKKKEPRTYERVKGTKDEALDAGPERKGTHTDRIISTSSLKSSSGAYVPSLLRHTLTLSMCAFTYAKRKKDAAVPYIRIRPTLADSLTAARAHLASSYC